jgi:2-hydroxy-3-keto-5-methylthiopentenyl-1-phosphate phosphatase
LRPLTLILDFDGTITTQDVGAALCDRFAPGVLERVDARWLAGEISFGEAYRLACLELRAPHAELVDHALATAVVRDGFGHLIEAALARHAHVIVASAGLDLYVEPVLRRELGELAARLDVRANAGTATQGGLVVSFPHASPDCAHCANCKGVPARRARDDGRRVIGAGDSFTDRCLVREADHVFARGWLSAHCAEHGIAHDVFDDFHPVTALLKSLHS